MKIHLRDFRVSGGKKSRISKKWATDVAPLYKSEKHYKELLAKDVSALGYLQRLLYASNDYALLLVFQAMDAAGKDGAISHVLSGINPQGCDVHSFKHPSAEELEHDFLWRTTRNLPTRGRIGVFNRSYYEEVLIVRVHPDILRSERIPGEHTGSKKDWKGRYRSIVELEKHLHRNGTVVLKFFLHSVGREEQRKRFLARIDETGQELEIQRGRHCRARRSGTTTWRLTKTVSPRPAPRPRHGTSYRRTTNTTRG